MIQLNLLPDVKTKYIKAQHSKRRVVLSSVIISCSALALVFLLGTYVYAAQKIRLNMVENSIKENSAKLKSIEGLDKILTIQNQLNKLTDLHQQKPVVSRLFTFLPQLTPNDVQISNLDLKYDANTMQFMGTAKSLEAVNKFVDTLKFTKYTTEQSPDQKSAFSEVVLSSFSVASNGATGATYSITLKFDPVIFSSDSKNVTLIVPKITSTRSQTEQPSALFNAKPAEGGNQ